MSAFIGVDWGTTNLRAWRIKDGAVADTLELDKGVSALSREEIPTFFEREVRTRLGPTLPALMCGMIGSNLGWREAPYVECPAGLRDLAAAAVSVREQPSVRIAPGLRCTGITHAPDIMRGEETQIMGWLAASPEHPRGRHLLCLPGTHSKWAVVQDGTVERFITAMTGELFHVLRKHSVLAVASSESASLDDDAFSAGLAAAGDGDALSVRLFSARARLVAANADPASAASYLSGLLIGSELAAAAALLHIERNTPIHLIAAPLLCDRYARALRQRGQTSVRMDGSAAAIAGLRALVDHGALA